MPDSTSVEDCYRIAEKHGRLRQFPPSTRELFERNALEETPKSDDQALSTACAGGRFSELKLRWSRQRQRPSAGFTVHVDNSCDDWDYELAAEDGWYACASQGESPHVCLISGGEVTVKVTSGGLGGRNQQFVRACAAKIAGESITVLSAGTDGVDGKQSGGRCRGGWKYGCAAHSRAAWNSVCA